MKGLPLGFGPLLEAPPAVRRRVGLGFAYFFLVMTGYYLLKPLRAALITRDLGAEILPRLNLLLLPTLLVVAALYDRILHHVPRRVVMPALALSLSLQPLIFRGVWHLGQGDPSWMWWIGAIYYLWLGVFNVFAVMAFWSMANDMFSPAEARRFFGYVGAGGPTGALLGSVLAQSLARPLGSANLLVLAAVIFAPCTFMASLLVGTGDARREEAEADVRPPAPDRSDAPRTKGSSGGEGDEETRKASGFRLIASSRYLLVLGATILLSKLVNGIFDYHYHILLGAEGMTRDQLTAFGAGVFLKVNVLAIGLQLFVVGWALGTGGPTVGLVLLPLVCCVGSVAVLAGAGLHTFAAVSILGQAVMYSLYQASREFLYVPTDRQTKYRAKAVLDTFGFRAGTGCGALVIMLFQGLGDVHVQALALLALVLAFVWAGLAVGIGRKCQAIIDRDEQAREGSAGAPAATPRPSS